jgi:dephospho-CoA kinase
MSTQNPLHKPASKLYALTGGIGTGKSTVAQLFQALGARIIDADQLARQVVLPGTQGLKQVISHFGAEFLSVQGDLDRSRLAAHIFSERSAREQLEKILHPLIRQEFLKLWQQLDKDSYLATFYVVPLFYESAHSYPEVSKVIVVWAPEALCVDRLIIRNRLTQEQALERIHSQIDIDKKAAQADWVIKNDGDIAALKPQVDLIWSQIINLSQAL